MTENRDKLLAKIKALFAKTDNAGATEAEALAAAEKAHELIERYQIDLGADELKREGFIKRTIEVETSRFTFARRILNGIDKFCEVKTWIWNWRPDEEEDRVLYRIRGATDIYVIGLASDTEFAAYLIESLTMFAMGGVTPHIAAQRKMAIALGTPLTASDSREVRRSYLLGCANRSACGCAKWPSSARRKRRSPAVTAL